MERQNIEEDERGVFADVPPRILRDIEAGLDDLRHGRTDPGHVVLATIDAKIAAWSAKNP